MSEVWRIGIDGNEANVEKRVGSNVYAWELLQHLYLFLEKNPLFTVVIYLSSDPVGGWPRERSWWKYRVVRPAKLWTQWRLPLDLYLHKDVDLFFSPGHYLPRFSPVPTVCTIMDIAYEYYPQYFKRSDLLQLRSWTAHSIAQAKHIFAISESTKQDIAKHYARRESDLTVIYPAVKKVKRVDDSQVRGTREKFQLDDPFIIYVGTLQPRKNIERLVGAFEALVDSGWEGKLVLAGKIGWLGEPIEERIQKSPHKEKIVQTGYVSEAEKTALIQSAECAVLVGLYEGFGIPPLEAIQLGTIPVVSETSSLPEVVGNGGVFVNPLDEKDIARGIQNVLSLKREEKEKRLGQLTAHASQFSWEKSAEKVAQTLLQILNGTHVL